MNKKLDRLQKTYHITKKYSFNPKYITMHKYNDTFYLIFSYFVTVYGGIIILLINQFVCIHDLFIQFIQCATILVQTYNPYNFNKILILTRYVLFKGILVHFILLFCDVYPRGLRRLYANEDLLIILVLLFALF